MNAPHAAGTGWLTLAVVIGLVVGGFLAIQPSANGLLGRHMQHPLQASLVSFGSGFGIVLLMTFAWGIFPPRLGVPAAQLPYWVWIGGAIGVLVVTSSLILVPKVGSLPWFAAVMTGQTVLAMLLDHYGWMGNPRVPASPLRVAGVVLLILGVLAIVQSQRNRASANATATAVVDQVPEP